MTTSKESAKRPRTTGLQVVVLAWCLVLALDVLVLWFGPSETLDQKAWYASDSVYAFLDHMGSRQRDRYAQTELLDLCLIASYTTAARLSLARLFDSGHRARHIAMIPGCFDLLETVGVWIILQNFPNHLPWLARAISIATPCKWIGALAMLAAMFTGWGCRRSQRSEHR